MVERLKTWVRKTEHRDAVSVANGTIASGTHHAQKSRVFSLSQGHRGFRYLDVTNNSKNYIIQLEKIVKLQAIIRYSYISNLKNYVSYTKVTYLIIARFASDKELLKYIKDIYQYVVLVL